MGEATARFLARDGAPVILAGLNTAPAAAIAAEITALGGVARAILT